MKMENYKDFQFYPLPVSVERALLDDFSGILEKDILGEVEWSNAMAPEFLEGVELLAHLKRRDLFAADRLASMSTPVEGENLNPVCVVGMGDIYSPRQAELFIGVHPSRSVPKWALSVSPPVSYQTLSKKFRVFGGALEAVFQMPWIAPNPRSAPALLVSPGPLT